MAAVADEGRLARAAAAGDGAAFAQLYDAYESRIFNFCLRLVGSREDAADATQDAFVKVLARLPKITGELNFGAYLFTAARNASYDIIGRRKRAEPVEEIGDVSGRPLHGDERGHISVDPERAAMLADLQVSVQAANARLPERQREVLALRELEELSYDEIAAVMDMNRNSVAQLISRARIKLRDELVGSALTSVSATAPDCQRALGLIAMRQDGQLGDSGDQRWLKAHIAACATCKVSVEAMEEAGVSYRAWAPIVPLLWLRKATIAKAAELTGYDWSEAANSPRSDPGASHGSGGSGGSGGGSAGAGGQLAGVGVGGQLAGQVGALQVADDVHEGRRHRRRLVLAGLGLALLGVLFTQLAGGDDSDSSRAARPAAETILPIVTPNPTATQSVTPVPAHRVRHHRRHRRRHHHHRHAAKVVVTSTPLVVPSTPTTVAHVVTSVAIHHAAPKHHTASKHHTTTAIHPGGGSGSSGTTGSTRPPLTGTYTAPSPPPPPTTTAAAPPPTTTAAAPPPTTTATTTTTQPPTRPCRPSAAGIPCPPTP